MGWVEVLLQRWERGRAVLWRRCNLARLSVTLPNLGFAQVTYPGAQWFPSIESYKKLLICREVYHDCNLRFFAPQTYNTEDQPLIPSPSNIFGQVVGPNIAIYTRPSGQ